jgi:DNA repair exonuclease SbcCD ATPase subunit
LKKRRTRLSKKGLCVWLFSSLTFISVIHLSEAVSVLIFNNQIRLLQLYPVINEKLQNVSPATYFWVSAVASVVFWAITCVVAFDNPVEKFLNTILSDARKQGAVETQLVEEKSEVLDAMYETIESSNETLAHVRDMMYNVRTETKEIQPLAESVEKIKSELNSLKREVKRLEEKAQFPNLCPACGKPLLPEFKLCPFCGESTGLRPEKILSVQEYR